MRRVAAEAVPARRVVDDALAALGVAGDAREDWLLATALALPGWAGMFARLERNPDDHPGGPPARLLEFVAVRLLLERHATARACEAAGLPVAWPALAARMPAPPSLPAPLAASRLWHLTAAAGLSPAAVSALDDATLATLWDACAACSDLVRRRTFLDAYERTYRRLVLDALAARRAMPPAEPEGRPRAQFVFCIDEREESIRRAVEEQAPDFVTYGAAGFFGVAIDYQGLYDRAPAAYCPVVVTPGHEVYEQPVYTALSWHALRKSLRDAWLGWVRRSSAASRTLVGGAGLSFLLGPVIGLKTLARVAAPRASLRLGETVKSRLAPRPATRLSAVRLADKALAEGGKPVGFSLQEAVDRVAATLTNIGLTCGFAPIVVWLGHGSTSLNNPHESAHDCGACGGRRGGANARLFADMANRPDVRDALRARGIDIPPDTWFVGALHDTADDSVRYYDLEALPPALAAAFDVAVTALERARRESARERCRRFDDAPLDLTPEAALAHVEERSSHLAQPRPEYGHCTNAICLVGRRAVSRGLHLDRRAFLVSYDPAPDTSYAVLERILAAVGPVGAGISLEYYFSSVDNERFGCGTKLPHNVTGLIGVMNGHQGDLRTGLPLQMVELHEPMRLLLVVEATPEALLTVAGRQPGVAELVVNQWVQLVSQDPDSGALAVFEDGAFVPYAPRPTLLPVVEQSAEWHQRSRAFVAPALVRRALPSSVVGPGHDGGPGAAVFA
ncbi:MAG: putative inorganic carbon transporter subunit DabA [Vicinamibacterales bacterium]